MVRTILSWIFSPRLFQILILPLGVPLLFLSNSSQPPAARTGAPGESTCAAAGCHSGPAYTGNVMLVISSPSSGWMDTLFPGDTFWYVPDSIYTMQLSLLNTTGSRFGFELTILAPSGATAGTFMLSDPANTSSPSATVGGQTRTYVAHKNASALSSWVWQWQAPPFSDSLRLFLAVNDADGNGSPSGDAIGTFQFPVVSLLPPDSVPSSIPSQPPSSLSSLSFPREVVWLSFTGQELFRARLSSIPELSIWRQNVLRQVSFPVLEIHRDSWGRTSVFRISVSSR